MSKPYPSEFRRRAPPTASAMTPYGPTHRLLPREYGTRLRQADDGTPRRRQHTSQQWISDTTESLAEKSTG